MFTFKIMFCFGSCSSCHFKPTSVFYYLFSSVLYLGTLCIQHPKEFTLFCMLSAVKGPAYLIISWTNGGMWCLALVIQMYLIVLASKI